jgi:hypothetical protein
VLFVTTTMRSSDPDLPVLFLSREYFLSLSILCVTYCGYRQFCFFFVLVRLEFGVQTVLVFDRESN